MLICLDLETTGFNPNHDKIIEVGAVRFDLDGKIHDTFSSLVNPGCVIPDFITVLTGIENSALAHAPRLEDIKEKIMEFCGGLAMVGHNAPFDYGFLEANNMTNVSE